MFSIHKTKRLSTREIVAFKHLGVRLFKVLLCFCFCFLLLSILWILSFFIYSTIAFLSFFSLIRCGNIFCSDCLSFEMKLSIEAKPDPYGVTCKVCQTCFEDKRTGFFFLFLSYYFFSFFSFFSFSLFLFLSLFLSFSHSFSLSLFFLTPKKKKKKR